MGTLTRVTLSVGGLAVGDPALGPGGCDAVTLECLLCTCRGLCGMGWGPGHSHTLHQQSL